MSAVLPSLLSYHLIKHVRTLHVSNWRTLFSNEPLHISPSYQRCWDGPYFHMVVSLTLPGRRYTLDFWTKLFFWKKTPAFPIMPQNTILKTFHTSKDHSCQYITLIFKITQNYLQTQSYKELKILNYQRRAK